MKGKFGEWFSGLSKVGKTATIAVALVGSAMGISAVADPCNDAVAYSNQTVNEAVDFPINATKDPTINVGISKIQKPGIEGENQVTYKIGTKCSDQVSKVAIKTVVKKEPVAQDELQGSREVSTETADVAIPFSNQDVPDSTMDKGTSKIVQSGVNGSKKVTYEVVKIDGKEQSRTQKSEEVTLQPVTQVTHIGTKTNNCDPNYSPCIPYYAGDALNCGDIRMRVRVIGYDHNNFDGNDNDGWGCESY